MGRRELGRRWEEEGRIHDGWENRWAGHGRRDGARGVMSSQGDKQGRRGSYGEMLGKEGAEWALDDVLYYALWDLVPWQ